MTGDVPEDSDEDLSIQDESDESCTDYGRLAHEARAWGKSLRSSTPRRSHADLSQAPRIDPIATLEETSLGRLKHLIPIRFGRMLESPLAFLRGAALVMARDLQGTPRSGIDVQVCGDAHLMNFGLFASPERNLLFDLNDFDETLVGPWEWDMKRLATSFVVAGRTYGLDDDTCKDCARACVRSYREKTDEYSQMPLLDVWYSRVDGDSVDKFFDHGDREEILGRVDQAHRRDHRHAVAKLARDESGSLRFREDPPLITHAPCVMSAESLQRVLASYRESLEEDRRLLFDGYRVIDHAMKVVGVGSVGTRCFVVLLGSTHRDDALVLQVKEATPSILEGLASAAWEGNEGKRTVLGQRLIQGFTDIFLGWGTDGVRDYYVRQLRDMKGQLSFADSASGSLSSYARLCGWVLARAHARSGSSSILAGYLGKSETFDEAMATFAVTYADQTEADFSTFKKAVKSGRLPAEEGL